MAEILNTDYSTVKCSWCDSGTGLTIYHWRPDQAFFVCRSCKEINGGHTGEISYLICGDLAINKVNCVVCNVTMFDAHFASYVKVNGSKLVDVNVTTCSRNCYNVIKTAVTNTKNIIMSKPALSVTFERHVCYKCGGPPTKKCSKCQIAKYCSRECQLANWPDHKELCNNIHAGGQRPITTRSKN